MAAAARAGGAIAAIPVADTLKRVTDSAIAATVSRTGLWQAQTPQAFRREVLTAAHQRAVNEGIAATDDADLVERTGVRVEVVEGSTANIKITTPSDLAIVEAIVAGLCIINGFAPGGLNVDSVDPAFTAAVLTANRSLPVRRVVSNSFGFGGINCSLVLGAAG